MFLFILESIGTQELLLIAAVALIVFGPRKLPDMAKKIGKTLAEFRNATNEFKSTWEKEARFEVDEKVVSTGGNSIARESQISDQEKLSENGNEPLAPEIKELSSGEIERIFKTKESPEGKIETEEIQAENVLSTKKDWL